MTDRDDDSPGSDSVESAVSEADNATDAAPEVTIESEPYGAGTPDGSDAPDDDPFAEISDVDSDDDPFAEISDVDSDDDDPFEELGTDLETIDEEFFEALDDGEDAAMTTLGVESDPEVEHVGEGVVVPKRSYCERCQYFSDPPNVACEHPGTTIHELTDVDHFRVSECPVVANRGDLSNSDE